MMVINMYRLFTLITLTLCGNFCGFKKVNLSTIIHLFTNWHYVSIINGNKNILSVDNSQSIQLYYIIFKF